MQTRRLMMIESHERQNLISRRRFFGIGATGVALLAIPACGGSKSPDPEEPKQSDGQGDVQVTGPPVLGPVVWATAVLPGTSEPTTPVDSFPVETSTIYAVFPVERIASGVVLRATWSFNGQTIPEVGAELTASRDLIGGWLEFHLVRDSDQPWPDGQYGISLSSESVLVATGSVAVVRTDQ